jgi:hypothetical protein
MSGHLKMRMTWHGLQLCPVFFLSPFYVVMYVEEQVWANIKP